MEEARKEIYDLHIHSYYSDGDLSPTEAVRELVAKGVSGVALTDHNGLWGVHEAAEAANKLGIGFLSGIEVSAKFNGIDVHILGYSKSFDMRVMDDGLAKTREGYMERISKMVELCQAEGYEKIDVKFLQQKKGSIKDPIVMSYDLGKVLSSEYGLSVEEARKLTVDGGACHVPYGDWVLSIREAVAMIHKAKGVAVFAHPGAVWGDHGEEQFMEVWKEMLEAEIDGVEVYYTYHDVEMVNRLKVLAESDQLILTGGTDWHGPGRYKEMDEVLGKMGIDREDYEKLMEELSAKKSKF